MRKPADGERPPVVAATGLTCADVADALPGMVDGSGSPSEQARTHVAACLRCQADLAHYRRLLRLLRSLGSAEKAAAGEDLEDLLARLDALTGGRHPQLARRAAYVGGMVVATAAASAAGVLVWASRRRDLAS